MNIKGKLVVIGSTFAVAWMSWLTFYVIRTDTRLAGVFAGEMDANGLRLSQDENGRIFSTLGLFAQPGGGTVAQAAGPDQSSVTVLNSNGGDCFIDIRTDVESSDDCMVTLERKGARIRVGFSHGVPQIVATDAQGGVLWQVPEHEYQTEDR